MSKVGADNIVFGYHKVHLVGHAAERAEVFFGPEPKPGLVPPQHWFHFLTHNQTLKGLKESFDAF